MKHLQETERTRYTNLMWGNKAVNKMTNKNATASTINVQNVQSYRVKNNNKKMCAWTSD